MNEGALKNLIMILNEFMQFRMTYDDELVSCMKSLPELRIYHPCGASLAICKKEDEMACDVEFCDSATYKKMSIFDMHPPCFPRRPVTCKVELQSPSVYHMNYGGSTKLFAEAFNTAGALYCTNLASPSDTYPEIFRVLKDIPLQDALAKFKFKSIHNDVLSSSPILVRTNRHGFDAVNVIKFLEELNLLANVKIGTDWAVASFAATMRMCISTSPIQWLSKVCLVCNLRTLQQHVNSKMQHSQSLLTL